MTIVVYIIFGSPAQGVIPLSLSILSTILGKLARIHLTERYGRKERTLCICRQRTIVHRESNYFCCLFISVQDQERLQRITWLPVFLLLTRFIFPTLKNSNQLVGIDKHKSIEWVVYESVQQKCIIYKTAYFTSFVPVYIVLATS